MDLHAELIAKVRQYRAPAKVQELLLKPKPLLIAGISAAGKNAIIKEIVDKGLGAHVITHTTRMPRNSENNGQNYWFVSEKEMLNLIDEREFIEVKSVHGNSVYGTSIAAYEKVAASGKLPILVIDVQGVDEIIKRVPDLHAKFVLPPDADEWLSRLHKREVITSADRHHRTVSARQEIEKALSDKHFDLVINRDVSEAADEVVKELSDAARQKQNQEIARKLLEQIRDY